MTYRDRCAHPSLSQQYRLWTYQYNIIVSTLASRCPAIEKRKVFQYLAGEAGNLQGIQAKLEKRKRNRSNLEMRL